MPIYNSPLLEIDTKEVRRYAGLRKSDFPESLIDEACLEGRLLAQPKGSWEIYDYDTKSQTVYDTVPFKIDGNIITVTMNPITGNFTIMYTNEHQHGPWLWNCPPVLFCCHFSSF